MFLGQRRTKVQPSLLSMWGWEAGMMAKGAESAIKWETFSVTVSFPQMASTLLTLPLVGDPPAHPSWHLNSKC